MPAPQASATTMALVTTTGHGGRGTCQRGPMLIMSPSSASTWSLFQSIAGRLRYPQADQYYPQGYAQSLCTTSSTDTAPLSTDSAAFSTAYARLLGLQDRRADIG